MKTFSRILMIATLAAGVSAHALTNADMFGRNVAVANAARTVEIDRTTRYVNVRQGDIVTLRDEGRSVTWLFDGVRSTVPLAAILPGAPDASNVVVYVDIPSNN
jgi:hypothetical protein